MYHVGDKIVYPMHGAGVIESIEEKYILGEKRDYYILTIPVGNVTVMLPVTNADGIGVRAVLNPAEIDHLFDNLKSCENNFSENWNKRYRDNLEIIRSGNIEHIAQIIKFLIERENLKGLSSTERKMLNHAKQILYSEVILSKNVTYDDVEDKFKECIGS